MKEFNMLIWLSQLGLSVAIPLGGFTLLGMWLKNRYELGAWVILCGCALGLIFALDGLRYSIKAMMTHEKNVNHEKKEEPPRVSYNDHD